MGDYGGCTPLQVSVLCLLATVLFIISVSHGLTPSQYEVGLKYAVQKASGFEEFMEMRIAKGYSENPGIEIGLPLRVKNQRTGYYQISQISGLPYEPHVMCLEVRGISKVTTILVDPLPKIEKVKRDRFKYSLFQIDGHTIMHYFSNAPEVVSRRLNFLCSLTDPDPKKLCNMPRDCKPSVPFQPEVRLEIENSLAMEEYLRWMFKGSGEKVSKTFSRELVFELKNSERQLIETIQLKPKERTSSKWFADNAVKLAADNFYEFRKLQQYTVAVLAKTSGDLLFKQFLPELILQAPSTARLKLDNNSISWDISYNEPQNRTDLQYSYSLHGLVSQSSPRNIKICKLPFNDASHVYSGQTLCGYEREDLYSRYFGIMVADFTTVPKLWKMRVEVISKDEHGAATFASQFEVQRNELEKRWIWHDIAEEFNRMLSVHVSMYEEGKQPMQLLNYTPLTKYKLSTDMIKDGTSNLAPHTVLVPHGYLPFKGFRNLMLIFHDNGVNEAWLGPNYFREASACASSELTLICQYQENSGQPLCQNMMDVH